MNKCEARMLMGGALVMRGWGYGDEGLVYGDEGAAYGHEGE